MNGRDALLLAFLLLPQPLAAQQDSLRVFFLGLSEFAVSGGMPAPFHEVCRLAGAPCNARQFHDIVPYEPGNNLPPRLPDIVANPDLLRIVATEDFDAVLFTSFAWNTEFYQSDPDYTAAVFGAFQDLYRMTTVAGARLHVLTGYATLRNPGDAARIAEGTGLLTARLDSLARAAGTPGVLRVPAGEFFNHMAAEFGAERWYADPRHATEFGQYAIARFLFTCMTGRSPRTFGHPERIALSDARRIDHAIVMFQARCPARPS